MGSCPPLPPGGMQRRTWMASTGSGYAELAHKNHLWSQPVWGPGCLPGSLPCPGSQESKVDVRCQTPDKWLTWPPGSPRLPQPPRVTGFFWLAYPSPAALPYIIQPFWLSWSFAFLTFYLLALPSSLLTWPGHVHTGLFQIFQACALPLSPLSLLLHHT